MPVRTVATVAPWRTVTALGLSLAGLGVSTYLTIVHFAPSVPLACSSNGIVNCERVTTSPQSYVFGIPVAAELLVIRNICPWCTSVHVVIFLLFVLLVTTVPSMLGWNDADARAK